MSFGLLFQEELMTVDSAAPQEIVFTVKPEEIETPAMEVEPEEVPEEIVVPQIIDRPKVGEQRTGVL